MKSFNPISFFALLFAALSISGCAYKGQLKPGFYETSPTAPKLPLRAALVIGPTYETGTFTARNLYYSHSVSIKTHPALKQALEDAMQSAFASVKIVPSVSLENEYQSEVLLLPTVAIQEHVLTLGIDVKNPNSGELVGRYESSGNIQVNAPASVHIIGTLNAMTVGALSPIVAPSITQILGSKAERELGQRIKSCLLHIEEKIRNDPFLVKKLKAVPSANPQER